MWSHSFVHIVNFDLFSLSYFYFTLLFDYANLMFSFSQIFCWFSRHSFEFIMHLVCGFICVFLWFIQCIFFIFLIIFYLSNCFDLSSHSSQILKVFIRFCWFIHHDSSILYFVFCVFNLIFECICVWLLTEVRFFEFIYSSLFIYILYDYFSYIYIFFIRSILCVCVYFFFVSL